MLALRSCGRFKGMDECPRAHGECGPKVAIHLHTAIETPDWYVELRLPVKATRFAIIAAISHALRMSGISFAVASGEESILCP